MQRRESLSCGQSFSFMWWGYPDEVMNMENLSVFSIFSGWNINERKLRE